MAEECIREPVRKVSFSFYFLFYDHPNCFLGLVLSSISRLEKTVLSSQTRMQFTLHQKCNRVVPSSPANHRPITKTLMMMSRPRLPSSSSPLQPVSKYRQRICTNNSGNTYQLKTSKNHRIAAAKLPQNHSQPAHRPKYSSDCFLDVRGRTDPTTTKHISLSSISAIPIMILHLTHVRSDLTLNLILISNLHYHLSPVKQYHSLPALPYLFLSSQHA
jgi:hypothetical protein